MSDPPPKCSDYADCNTCSAGSSASNGVCYWCPNASESKCVDPDAERDKYNDNQATCSRDCTPTPVTPATTFTQCSQVTDCSRCTNLLIPDSDGGYCSWNANTTKCSAIADEGNVTSSASCPAATATSCTTFKDCATCSATKIGNDSCYWDAVDNKCDVYGNTKNVATTCEPSGNASGEPSDDMSLEDMLAYLSNLQTLEESLYKLLTNSAQNITSGTGGMTDAEINIIVGQINDLSAQRAKIYSAVSSMYSTRAQYEFRIGNTIEQQLTTLKFLENEMNKSKQTIQNSKDEKIKTMKMVEINTYFSHEYEGYTYLMQIVALIGALLLASTFLTNPVMSNALFQVVSYAGGVYVLYLIIDLMQRRNTNFDEYTFPMAPKTDADMQAANANGEMVLDVSGIDIDLCAGSYCCAEGTEWKDTYGCVPKST